MFHYQPSFSKSSYSRIFSQEMILFIIIFKLTARKVRETNLDTQENGLNLTFTC